MEQRRLCSECFLLVQNKLTATHENLRERNHIYNDTVYECSNCRHLLRLTNVPHEWSILSYPEDETDLQTRSA
ncbi:hypothetical protein [uncultured Amphritea sp.]|uniref:hypothetical protein n=1 Tax=uncultured Amphritea sp. TaxID=981605 RepID=UPI0026188320|nr:hypothetical protein [uncultured Amphritea sp.]